MKTILEAKKDYEQVINLYKLLKEIYNVGNDSEDFYNNVYHEALTKIKNGEIKDIDEATKIIEKSFRKYQYDNLIKFINNKDEWFKN